MKIKCKCKLNQVRTRQVHLLPANSTPSIVQLPPFLFFVSFPSRTDYGHALHLTQHTTDVCAG